MKKNSFTWTSQYNATEFRVIVANLDTFFEKNKKYRKWKFYDAAGTLLDKSSSSPLGVHMDICFTAHFGKLSVILIDDNATLHEALRSIFRSYLERYVDNVSVFPDCAEEFLAYDLGTFIQTLVDNNILDLKYDKMIETLIKKPAIIGYRLMDLTTCYVAYGPSDDIVSVISDVDNLKDINLDDFRGHTAQSWKVNNCYLLMYKFKDGLTAKKRMRMCFFDILVHESIHQVYHLIRMMNETHPSSSNFATMLATQVINSVNLLTQYVTIMSVKGAYKKAKGKHKVPMILLTQFETLPHQRAIFAADAIPYIAKTRSVLPSSR